FFRIDPALVPIGGDRFVYWGGRTASNSAVKGSGGDVADGVVVDVVSVPSNQFDIRHLDFSKAGPKVPTTLPFDAGVHHEHGVVVHDVVWMHDDLLCNFWQPDDSNVVASYSCEGGTGEGGVGFGDPRPETDASGAVTGLSYAAEAPLDVASVV